MYLWRISQQENNSYDTFDAAIVAAENEEEARRIHPSEGWVWHEDSWVMPMGDGSFHKSWSSSWANPECVMVELIGIAKEGTEAGVLTASFNAG